MPSHKFVVLSATIEIVERVPVDWDADEIEFYKNESSSCANNTAETIASVLNEPNHSMHRVCVTASTSNICATRRPKMLCATDLTQAWRHPSPSKCASYAPAPTASARFATSTLTFVRLRTGDPGSSRS